MWKGRRNQGNHSKNGVENRLHGILLLQAICSSSKKRKNVSLISQKLVVADLIATLFFFFPKKNNLILSANCQKEQKTKNDGTQPFCFHHPFFSLGLVCGLPLWKGLFSLLPTIVVRSTIVPSYFLIVVRPCCVVEYPCISAQP